MSDPGIREHNKRYLNLDDAQYDEHRRLMAMKMSDWPVGVIRHVRVECARTGKCGDVIAVAVADWIRARGPNR